jgi:hypothetical protein
MLIDKTISESGLVREYYQEGDTIVAAVLRNRPNEQKHMKLCAELKNSFDIHAMKNQTFTIARIPEDIWIKILNDAGIVEPFSEEAINYVQGVILTNRDYAAFRTAPEKVISHQTKWV